LYIIFSPQSFYSRNTRQGCRPVVGLGLRSDRNFSHTHYTANLLADRGAFQEDSPFNISYTGNKKLAVPLPFSPMPVKLFPNSPSFGRANFAFLLPI
jgi:hypothetical protein